MWAVGKTLFSALIIVAASEAARRSTLLGALLVSLPLMSLLAMTWLYIDTKDVEQVARMSTEIFWLVLPTLVFFILFPLLVERGLGFVSSMVVSIGGMVSAYGVTVMLLRRVSDGA